MLIEFDETPRGGDVVSRLQELDRISARIDAIRADLLVEAADPQPHIDEYLITDECTAEERRILIEDPMRDELACALRIAASTMQAMIDTARTLVGRVPAVHAALRAGEITLAHARHLVDAAERLPDHMVEEFVRLVLPTAKASTPTRTKTRANAVVARLDREGCERRRQQAKATRDVWVSPEADGMSLLIARMTTQQAYACKIQIDADGFDRAYSVDAKAGLTFGEYRVEALAALILGGNGAGSAPTTAHVSVTIDLPTLLALRDDSAAGIADLQGEGTVTASVVRDLLADPDCAVTLRRLVTDPMTGHLLDYGRKTYAIPQALREFIIARDKTCRFPGCNRRGELCEIDHAVPWHRGGTTDPCNCGPLCKRHHQLKTHGGWHIIESRPDGSCVWRSPQGRYYEYRPPDIEQRE